MSGTISVIKTLIVPAVISLLLFLLLTFILVPVWRHYRTRYSQYLPLDAIQTHTSSIPSRIAARLTALALPSRWAARHRSGRDSLDSAAGGHPAADAGRADRGSSESQGEELEDVDDETWRIIAMQPQLGRADTISRLSRDLEEGFRDDSDEERHP